MESWHILSPLASETSSMPISLALYLTPSPLNLPSRYSSVFSNTKKKSIKKKNLKKRKLNFHTSALEGPNTTLAHLSFSPSWMELWTRWERLEEWNWGPWWRRWSRWGLAGSSPPLQTWCRVRLDGWVDGRGGGGIQAGSSGSARSSERMTPNTHTCFSSCESGAENSGRVKKKKMTHTHTHTS